MSSTESVGRLVAGVLFDQVSDGDLYRRQGCGSHASSFSWPSAISRSSMTEAPTKLLISMVVFVSPLTAPRIGGPSGRRPAGTLYGLRMPLISPPVWCFESIWTCHAFHRL
jgi:hypothetical protein